MGRLHPPVKILAHQRNHPTVGLVAGAAGDHLLMDRVEPFDIASDRGTEDRLGHEIVDRQHGEDRAQGARHGQARQPHDAAGGRGPRDRLGGMVGIDHREVVAILKAAGYDGPLTIEDESLGKFAGKEKKSVLRKDAAYLKGLLA